MKIFHFGDSIVTIPTEDNRIFVTNSASGGYFHHRWRMNFGPPTSIFDKKSAIQIMYGILPKKSQFFSSIFIPLLLVISLLIETWDHSLHIWVENGLRNILDKVIIGLFIFLIMSIGADYKALYFYLCFHKKNV